MKYDKENAIQLLNKAYQETCKRMDENWHPIVSTKRQLEYSINSILGKNDRSKLNKIMFHQYIIHEFEQTDIEFSNLLHEAASVIDLMVKGEL